MAEWRFRIQNREVGEKLPFEWRLQFGPIGAVEIRDFATCEGCGKNVYAHVVSGENCGCDSNKKGNE